INKKIYCLSDIKAIHLARFNNRKMLSKHFFWHVKSIMIFLSKTYMSKYFRGQSNG
ncbi:glycosyltransferase family 2 protein, partial [Escherichia coli]|nr:glycosyltransferase family 2 protein [Escherichia coli]